MTQPDANSPNPEWEKVAGDFAGEITARHRPMVKRIEGRITAPIRQGRLWRAAERFFPRIARKIAGKARWSGTLIQRASALSERIGRSLMLSDLRAEPIERVWLEEGQTFESMFPPEEPFAAGEPPPPSGGIPTPAHAQSRQRSGAREQLPPQAVSPRAISPAERVRRSPSGKALHFAAQATARLERSPLAAFSRPVLEGLGVLSPGEPIAEQAAFRPPPIRAAEEPAERGFPPAPIPLPPTRGARSEETPPPGRVAGAPVPRERASDESTGIARPVARYIQRAREPLSLIRGRPGALVSTGGGSTLRPAAFKSIIRREPVSMGLTPPAESTESEAPVSERLKAPPFTPPASDLSPAPLWWGRASGEPYPPSPFVTEKTVPPPEQPLAQKPSEPIHLRPTGVPGRGETALPRSSHREQRSSAPRFEAAVSRVPMKAVPPHSPPLSGAEKPEPPSPAAAAGIEETAGGRPEQPSRPKPAPAPELSPSPKVEPAAKAGGRSAGLQQTGAIGRKPEESPPPSPAETATNLAETILARYEPGEGTPPIVEMPIRREQPAAAGRLERKELGPPLPAETAPSLAETLLARYEPPPGIRQIERVSLPVSSPQTFAALFAPAKAEGPVAFGEPPFAGRSPEMFIPTSGRPEISWKPAPAHRAPLSPISGAGMIHRKSEPAPPAPTAPGERKPAGAIRTALEEKRAPAGPVAALYWKPAPIGPKAGAERKPAETIARAAASAAAESTGARPTEGNAAAAGETQPEGPDLDAIARQVYAIIRRRLAIERERLGR